VLSVTHLSRECPERLCTAVFTDSQWQSVWRVTTQSDRPSTPPPPQGFASLRVSSGGYNNRRGKLAPGLQVI